MKYFYLKTDDQICPTEISVESKERTCEDQVGELYYEHLDSDQATDMLIIFDEKGIKKLIKKLQKALEEK